MKLTHAVTFDFTLGLPQQDAIAFVRDVETSLSQARFIEGLEVDSNALVTASLPVNAALFGQQTLQFTSKLISTPKGAVLEPQQITTSAPGWAEVAGEAVVSPAPNGSAVRYHFDITIHLRLPEPEKWGGAALTKMIEFTASRVLERITASFPAAVQSAATEVEARYAT